MKSIIPSILLVLVAAPVHPQERLPVIDMHLHALAADAQGPPPVAILPPSIRFQPGTRCNRMARHS